jgi:hypothetical protein
MVLLYRVALRAMIDVLINLARSTFGAHYSIWYENIDHTHMMMDRSKDRSREVNEFLIITKEQ